LTLKDYEALKAGLTDVSGIAPTYQSPTTSKQAAQSIRVQVVGITEDYFPVNSAEWTWDARF
jgi:hypothetical protein